MTTKIQARRGNNVNPSNLIGFSFNPMNSTEMNIEARISFVIFLVIFFQNKKNFYYHIFQKIK